MVKVQLTSWDNWWYHPKTWKLSIFMSVEDFKQHFEYCDWNSCHHSSRWRTVSASCETCPITSTKKYQEQNDFRSLTPTTWWDQWGTRRRRPSQTVLEGKDPKVSWLIHILTLNCWFFLFFNYLFLTEVFSLFHLWIVVNVFEHFLCLKISLSFTLSWLQALVFTFLGLFLWH